MEAFAAADAGDADAARRLRRRGRDGRAMASLEATMQAVAESGQHVLQRLMQGRQTEPPRPALTDTATTGFGA